MFIHIISLLLNSVYFVVSHFVDFWILLRLSGYESPPHISTQLKTADGHQSLENNRTPETISLELPPDRVSPMKCHYPSPQAVLPNHGEKPVTCMSRKGHTQCHGTQSLHLVLRVKKKNLGRTEIPEFT